MSNKAMPEVIKTVTHVGSGETYIDITSRTGITDDEFNQYAVGLRREYHANNPKANPASLCFVTTPVLQYIVTPSQKVLVADVQTLKRYRGPNSTSDFPDIDAMFSSILSDFESRLDGNE